MLPRFSRLRSRVRFLEFRGEPSPKPGPLCRHKVDPRQKPAHSDLKQKTSSAAVHIPKHGGIVDLHKHIKKHAVFLRNAGSNVHFGRFKTAKYFSNVNYSRFNLYFTHVKFLG